MLAFRPIECLDEDGGGAPFSENGEEALGHLADSYGEDLELVGLQPVGWYRSRWESPIQLNQDDLRVWNRFFPLRSQVCLVIRVQRDSPVRAGFFFRPPLGGPVRIDSSFRTFEIDAGQEALDEGDGRVEPGTLVKETALVRVDTLRPPLALFTPPEQPKDAHYFLWAGIGLAALGLIAWQTALWFRPAAASRPAEDMALQFMGPPNRLKLVWNPRSTGLLGAERVKLRLVDADTVSTKQMEAGQLSRGQMPVANLAGLVEAQIHIHYRDVHQRDEVVAAQYVGPAAVDVPLPDHRDDLTPLLAEQANLKARVEKRIKARTALEERIDKLREVLARQGPGEAAQPKPPSAAKPDPIVVVAQNSPLPSTSTNAAGSAAALAPAFGADRTPSRGPAPLPEPPQAQAYTGPGSGKFIWTGYLAPGQTVTIDGRRASSGTVNGSLPGVPVRISVYPGEFSSTGLSVYSASPRHQAGPVTETRNAQNGWLNTSYLYDPARSRDAIVSAAPNEAGGFKQLQLTGGERPVSVVIVEWAVSR